MTEPTAEEIREMAAWAGLSVVMSELEVCLCDNNGYPEHPIAWNDGRLMWAAEDRLVLVFAFRTAKALDMTRTVPDCIGWWFQDNNERTWDSAASRAEAVWAAWREVTK